jgi:hypothetical protein
MTLLASDSQPGEGCTKELRATMDTERRFVQRTRPPELSYIQFEPEGGGIVVNASGQGLAFHAAAALRLTGPIQLCVSPTPMQQIKVDAEIVWMDETEKFGGVRFKELTAEARSQILQWLDQPGEPEPPVEESTVPSSVVMEESDPHLRPGSGTSERPSPALESASPTDSDPANRVAPRFGNISETALLSAPFSLESQMPIPRPRLLKGLATGFLILVLVFTPFLFSQNLRHGIGNSLIGVGEKLKGNRDVQPDASSPIPMISDQNSTRISSVHNTIPGNSAKESSDRPDSPASTEKKQRTGNSADSRPADRRDSRHHAADANARRERSALARQLWSAIGAGDDSAEVPLAELYLNGDGVPRSCEQARVLLRAASKKGNIEAMQQLRQLGKKTCR